MSETVKLTAADGHTFYAYRADPEGTPLGNIQLLGKITANPGKRPRIS